MSLPIIEQILQNVKPQKVNFEDYIELNNSNKLSGCEAYKIGNLVYLVYDIETKINQGATVIGKIKKKLLITCYGNSRVNDSSYKSFPGTTIAISEGEFRVHSSISAGINTTGTILLLLDEN